MGEKSLKISIAHLYPKLLNLYGDIGNIITLKKRCEWRDIEVEFEEINIGDKITVKSVNTDTLHEGDIIAFYVYADDYNSFDINSCVRIENDKIPATAYKTTFVSFSMKQYVIFLSL